MVEHVIEHDWFGWMNSIDVQTLDQVLLCEPLGMLVRHLILVWSVSPVLEACAWRKVEVMEELRVVVEDFWPCVDVVELAADF